MANWYVDASVGASGNGQSQGAAFKTLAEALSAMSGGDTVNVAGGVYREAMDLTGNGGASWATRTRFVGTPGDPFVVSGGVVVTGLSVCTSADEPVVGANYASIYKASVAKASLPDGNPAAANICENGVALTIAHDRADDTGDRFFIDDPRTWHTADAVIKSGANITGFQKASITATYTAAQIETGRVVFNTATNREAWSEVSSVSGGTINLATPAPYGSGDSHADDFALVNVLPAMNQGGWGYVDNGTTVTLYVWPNNPASVAGGIEYSGSATGIDFNGESNIEISDFVVRQIAPVTRSQAPIISKNGACSGITIRDFEVNYCLAATEDPYAMIYMEDVSDLTIHDFSMTWGSGLFGMFLRGSYSASWSGCVWAENIHVHSGTIDRVSSAPVRLYTVKDAVVNHLKLTRSAQSTHSNTFNAYQGCHNVLFWGIDGQDVGGFATWQSSSGICIAFCDTSASKANSGGNRAIFAQQGGTTPNDHFTPVDSYIFNNRGTPHIDRLGVSDNGLKCSDDDDLSNNYYVTNNIYHGHDANYFGGGQPAEWDYNVNTFPGATAVGANDNPIVHSTLYENSAAGNFNIATDSGLDAVSGKNMSAAIASLSSRFPQMVAFDKDMAGDTIDWNNPPIGPLVNYSGNPSPSLPVMGRSITINLTVGA